MFSLLFTLSSLLALTHAVAIPSSSPASKYANYDLSERAGAPIHKNITNCTLTSIYPSNVTNPGYGFLPSSTFTSANRVYSYTLVYSDFYGSEEETLESCLESCAGYGTTNSCQGVFLAYNVTTSEGAKPAQENFQCVQFGAPLTETSFVAPTVEGTYTFPKAVNIVCPA